MNNLRDTIDRELAESERRIKRLQKRAVIFSVACVVVGLSIAGVIGYIAFHFISKLW